MAKIRRKDPVAELLGTNNKKEQAAQIQQIMNVAMSPVLNILVTFDSRTSRVDAKQVGGEAPNELIQQILDGAKNLFNQQELARQVQVAQQEAQNELPETQPNAAPKEHTSGVPNLPPSDTEGVQNAE